MNRLSQTKAVTNDDTLYTELQDGEAVLLDLDTHAYYGLNVTGARIWQLLTRGFDLAHISEELQNQFDVTADQAQDHVSQFTNDLVGAKLAKLTVDGC